MGILGSSLGDTQAFPTRAAWCAVAAYVAVTGITIWHHEPWPDEAQSWLLARDSSLFQLWGRLLHYEGSPGLWQTLLHLLQRAGLPYAGMNYVSGVLGLGGAVLTAFFAPFPLPFRLALPFTYYLCYQYAVVARGYALLPVLLFACAWLFPQASSRWGWLTALLGLLAVVSIHGMALSLSFALAASIAVVRTGRPGKAFWMLAAGYAGVVLFAAACAWPAADVTFVRRLNFSAVHLFRTSGDTFAEALTGEWTSSLGAVALTVPFLWRNGALPAFLFSTASLCLVNGVVYSQVWHRGLLFLAWIAALWIAAQSAKFTWPVTSAVLAVVLTQGYWTAAAVAYDVRYPYSGAREAAAYLQDLRVGDLRVGDLRVEDINVRKPRIFGIGYACVAVQPYFPKNIFANLHAPGGGAFWDWSANNRDLAELDQLRERNPEYVLVGYTGMAEDVFWNSAVRHAGYRRIRHFEGNLFWQTGVLEPDAFDLYRRESESRKPEFSKP